MKKITLLSICLLLVAFLSAQKSQIKTVTLANGMNVVLCEDHSEPRVWGAVCVHAGAKNDPLDNTGMAHYLEHIMFKGTDKIGTIDWPSEKVYLDSITLMYDVLHDITDVDKRNEILLKINELNNKATDYAIPNEVDVILGKMGGEGVNAFTSNDVTVYLNSFPANQMEKWLEVYTERFRNPIFRLFQSELEAVYEEYNMYQDQPISSFMEDALATAYGEHPYGRPVIGYQKHLKNPQTSAMQKFFNTYYHPCNMTLVLVGDFSASSIRPLLDNTIGKLHNEGDGVDKTLAYRTERMNTDLNLTVKPFEGKQVVNVKETPIKMGVMGFQTCGSKDPEAFYLDIMSALLNNDSGTGLLDRLNNENKVMEASAFNYGMLEKGLFAFFYVPKLIGQSHEQAEDLILAAVDSLRKGHFSDDLFEAVKMECLKDFLSSTESLHDKFNTILGMVMSKQMPEELAAREQKIRNLTKQDIVNLAKKYFGDNMLMFRSSMGVKQHEKLEKPNWKPVVAQNTEAKSDYAKFIEDMPVASIAPQVINFEEKVSIVPVNESFNLYGTKNPCNDMFSMDVVFNYGSLRDRNFDNAIEYVSMQGTKDNSFEAFQLALQRLGASMSMYATGDELHVSISGFDKDMEQILNLCREKMYSPANDESKLLKIIDNKASEASMTKNDASEWGRALYYYAIYGANSPKLMDPSLKEVKKYTGDVLLQSFARALEYDGSVTYVGNLNFKDVAKLLSKTILTTSQAKQGEKNIRPVENYDTPTLFLVSNKHFLQSNIYYYVPGNPLEDEKSRVRCDAYNEYMGGGMAGVIFQEIRELRSLGYTAYAAYSYDELNRRPGFLMGFLGTQSDKTNEGCDAMSELMIKFPAKPEKFDMAKTSLLKKMELDYINFRDLPATVKNWMEQGYTSDPRVERMAILNNITMQDVEKFHKANIAERPMIITVAGDKSRMNIAELSKTYKIVNLKYKDIFR